MNCSFVTENYIFLFWSSDLAGENAACHAPMNKGGLLNIDRVRGPGRKSLAQSRAAFIRESAAKAPSSPLPQPHLEYATYAEVDLADSGNLVWRGSRALH